MDLTVEIVGFAEAEKVRDKWSALLLRALEPNIFMEPTFALAATQHLAEAQRPRFVLAWDGEPTRADAQLLGVWLLEAKSAPLNAGFIRTWESDYAVVGAPLIDRARAADVTGAILDAIRTAYGSHRLLLVPHVLKAGPTYGLLVSCALATGRTWSPLSAHARALLRPSGASDSVLGRSLSTKGRKELLRLRRRLESLGSLEYRSATGPDAIRSATEQFLVLESSGWKGQRATALLSAPGSATFTRSLLRLLAREGQCRIDSLALDGRPIAMAIVLNSGDRAYFWKTAFDESLAASSPGVQLTLDLTRRQEADPNLLYTDSCAIAGHPMIERLWPDRHEIADLAIAVSPGDSRTALAALRRERIRRAGREAAKRALILIRGRVLSILRRRGAKPT